MDMLVRVTNSWQTPSWITAIGNYNSMPTPFQEIDEAEWVRYARTWGMTGDYHESRQVFDLDGKPDERRFAAVQIAWYHDRALAVQLSEDGSRYFRIGCDHAWRELSQAECRERGIYHAGNCYHVSECATCGHVEAVDSSG